MYRNYMVRIETATMTLYAYHFFFKSNMFMYHLYELDYKACSVYTHAARNMKNIFIFFQLY